MKNSNSQKIEVSIIIVNWNAREALSCCIHSIYRTILVPFEIIVVDNHSSDGSVKQIREAFPHVIVIEQEENLGFSRANNIGFLHSSGRHILFLNPDTVLMEGAVKALLDFMTLHADAGIVGPKLLRQDGALDYTAKRMLPHIGNEVTSLFLVDKIRRYFIEKAPMLAAMVDRQYAKTEACECLSGSCMLLCRALAERLHGFDESVPMYLDDIDICCRCREVGFSNYYVAEASVIHIGGYSAARCEDRKQLDVLALEARAMYYRKHHGSAVELLYRLVILCSIPYLLMLDVLCFPFFLYRKSAMSWFQIVRKHLLYSYVVIGKKVKCIS